MIQLDQLVPVFAVWVCDDDTVSEGNIPGLETDGDRILAGRKDTMLKSDVGDSRFAVPALAISRVDVKPVMTSSLEIQVSDYDRAIGSNLKGRRAVFRLIAVWRETGDVDSGSGEIFGNELSAGQGSRSGIVSVGFDDLF